MDEPRWTPAVQMNGKKDGLLCSFYNQNYDFGDYVFKVVSTGENIDRS